MKEIQSRTCVEIDMKALKHNVTRLKNFLSPETKFMAVVKSNAYGHGMVEIAKELEKIGVDFLAVDDALEAFELRAGKIKSPILVLGYTLPVHFAELAKKNISITISSIESLVEATKFKLVGGKKLKIHIKVDTGLHRQGLFPDVMDKTIDFLYKNRKKLFVEGLYTHFAALESPDYIDYSRMQGERLARWQDEFLKADFDPIVHASASAGIVWANDDFHFDMVRAGISLYGLWPSEEIKATAGNTELYPILSWKTIVGEVKKIPSGSKIGYDLSESVSRDSVLVILPIGYWHGYDRSLSSRGEVLIKGTRAKVLGRISMDMTIVDATDVKGVKQGDEVVLLGGQGKDVITTEELALRANSINYEIVTRINQGIPRIVK